MTETTYNGWTNYETWAVALWLDNEQASYRYWRDQAREHRQAAPTWRNVTSGIWTAEEAAKNRLADQLKEEVHDAAPLREASLFSDLLGAALDEVNWYEIADHWLSEDEPAPQPPPPICTCSRAQAIADGLLVDATTTAAEAGLDHPTALTAAVWEKLVKVPEQVEGQDERNRLWNVISSLKTAFPKGGHPDKIIFFSVLLNGDARGPRAVRLKAVCTAGDTAEPVITIMLPDEA